MMLDTHWERAASAIATGLDRHLGADAGYDIRISNVA
jgi:hypothetical protein